MGNDGGSIPTRRELVKSAARAPTLTQLKETALESRTHAWSHCAFSDQPLDHDSVVSDWRGRLYNYESVLQALASVSTDSPDALVIADSDSANYDNQSEEPRARELALTGSGVHSLRDVIKLQFKRSAAVGQDRSPTWTCPISQKELGPSTKSAYVVPCGHVFSEVAIRKIPDESCPECSTSFKQDDVIPILTLDEAETDRLFRRKESLVKLGLTHSLKKEKGLKNKKKRRINEVEEQTNRDAQQARKQKHLKSGNVSDQNRDGNINNAMAASLTAKVLAEQEELSQRRKAAAASRGMTIRPS